MGALESAVYRIRSFNDGPYVARGRWGRYLGHTGCPDKPDKPDIFIEKNTQPKKITIIGMGTTGKTTLCELLQGIDHGDYKPTLGTDLFIINDDKKQINVWDVGGDEEYSKLYNMIVRDSDKIIIVCSPDQPNCLKTFDALEQIRDLLGKPQFIIVYNNKSDKSYEKLFSLDDLKEKCEKHKKDYDYKIFEVSLLENINTQPLVEEIIKF